MEIKLATHTVSGKPMYEVWVDGKMVAAIYPRPNGIRLMSRHVRADHKLTIDDVQTWDWEFKVKAQGAIEDVRNILQDFITPDVKEIKARLTALEKRMDGFEHKLDERTNEILSAINRITDYNQVLQRVAALEAKQRPSN